MFSLLGTLADPSFAYDSGKAILLVKENEVPNAIWQAATTENGSFVTGLKRYFDLICEHESVAEYLDLEPRIGMRDTATEIGGMWFGSCRFV